MHKYLKKTFSGRRVREGFIIFRIFFLLRDKDVLRVRFLVEREGKGEKEEEEGLI